MNPSDENPVDSGSQNQMLLEAIQVFQNISLLQIKRSYRDLLNMSLQSLENFVQKHSDFIIFLLNILDEERSATLLNRLTNSAIVYLSEEELRNLLIRQVGHYASRGMDFNSLSVFMDKVDKPEQNSLAVKRKITPEELDVIKMIAAMRSEYANRHFKYLDSIQLKRRIEICHEIMQRNLDVAIGLLMFCPDQMLINLIDIIAELRPRLLRFFPDQIFLKRFEFGYANYINKRIRRNLPKNIQILIEDLIQFAEKTEQFMLKLIEAFADPDLTAIQKRKIRLEELSRIVSTYKVSNLKIAFYDLREIGVIEDEDLDLISSLQSD